MIIYFSATGNCRFSAEQIATAIGEKAVNITEISNKISLQKGESLGIVTPTYFWGLPTYVEDFLKNIIIENAENSYIYCIATYGTTTGQTDYYVNRLLKKKGLHLSASYGIKTVDNWTVWFSVKNREAIKAVLDGEQQQIAEIIDKIKGKENIFISKDKKPKFMCRFARALYGGARKTAHLNVNKDCIGCGICEKGCPVDAIKIVDGRPEWVKEKCTMCLGCLHNCPKFAIQYDDKTKNNGQYNHPDTKKNI